MLVNYPYFILFFYKSNPGDIDLQQSASIDVLTNPFEFFRGVLNVRIIFVCRCIISDAVVKQKFRSFVTVQNVQPSHF